MLLSEMHRAKYNPNRMKANAQFRRAARLAKIDRTESNFAGKGGFTKEQYDKGKRTAYEIARNWG